jgi:hypothetical protein
MRCPSLQGRLLNGESWRGKIIENAKAVADYDEADSELVGYLVLGIFSEGRPVWAFGSIRTVARFLVP